MIDIKSVQKAAEEEVRAERITAAKGRLKAKIQQIENAKTVLANLNREYEDLVRAIGDGN